jgi:hypothetical protein
MHRFIVSLTWNVCVCKEYAVYHRNMSASSVCLDDTYQYPGVLGLVFKDTFT